MGREPQSIFFEKSSTFLSSVSPCIVSMNNEFSPIVPWLDLSQCCNDIITIVLGAKDAPLRKYHDQGKSQWIPCNGTHDFPVLDRMPRSFRRSRAGARLRDTIQSGFARVNVLGQDELFPTEGY
jgi:hypothetical protein